MDETVYIYLQKEIGNVKTKIAEFAKKQVTCTSLEKLLSLAEDYLKKGDLIRCKEILSELNHLIQELEPVIEKLIHLLNDEPAKLLTKYKSKSRNI
jgi:hypothetical protein